MKSLHISLNTAHSGCKPRTSMSLSTHSLCHSMSLSTHSLPKSPIPPPTSHPCHLHISTGWHQIIHTPMFQMPKPPQSATPHHIRHTLYTQKTVQIHTSLPILQRHSIHPSHHHPIRPLQTMQIFSLHHPCFSPICQHNLDTSSVSFPLCGMMHHELSR